jgi:UrcA family protein
MLRNTLAAALVLTVSQPSRGEAWFANEVSNPARVVRFDDLDLSTLAGVRTLHRRIARALDAVCAEALAGSWTFEADFTCKSDAWHSLRPIVARAVAARSAPRVQPPAPDARLRTGESEGGGRREPAQ